MKVRSFTHPNKFYWTTPAKCSCPHNTYRQVECKHMRLTKSIYDYASAWSNRTHEEVKTNVRVD